MAYCILYAIIEFRLYLVFVMEWNVRIVLFRGVKNINLNILIAYTYVFPFQKQIGPNFTIY